MIVRRLGRVGYVPTWEAMRRFTQERDAATADELWLLEHDPVYTLGLAGRREHLHAPGAIDVVKSDRGGQVTYHGPGQVVVYALIDLRRAGYFARELVFRLEEATIQALDAFGIDARRVQGAPGVYVAAPGAAASPDEVGPAPPGASVADARFAGLAKIAALGVRIQRACSYHGVALNVDMDLAPYEAMDPCGYRGLRAIDCARLGVRAGTAALGDCLLERLQAHLEVACLQEIP